LSHSQLLWITAPAAGPETRREENMNRHSHPRYDWLRVNMYTLLAALLARAPGDATLRLIEDIQPGPEADAADLGTYWRNLRAESLKYTTGQLEDEFHYLFIGLGRGEVIPYGSWYLIGHLMDHPLARLRGDLARLGIERRPGSPETEDHVAALCESMALLSRPDTVIPRGQLQLFFHHHLASWMPRFFKDLQAARWARFYRAVGRVGEAFIQREEEIIWKEKS
jgi:TorA maturation chaperone TorD